MRWLALLGAVGALILAYTPALAETKRDTAVQYPPYQGPRKTIAVTKFDAVGSFVARYGGWDIGGGLAAMLTAELARTNRFVVLDRADVDTLLREKQMALGGVTQGTTGAPLMGAQTFIRGSVTEFDQEEKGGGLNLGLAVGNLGGGGARRQATGHVAIELRLIDGETGAILATARVEKKVKSSSFALQGLVRNVTFGGDRFRQTSLGRASREAIEEAVAKIVAQMEAVPFQALVAKADGDTIYINAGRNANLASGARMRVFRPLNTITDPLTGQVLGSGRRTISDIILMQVEDRYSVGQAVTQRTPVERGDIVQLIGP